MRLVVGEPLLPIGNGWKAAHQFANKAHDAVEGLLDRS
jgi:hypothetical protein